MGGYLSRVPVVIAVIAVTVVVHHGVSGPVLIPPLLESLEFVVVGFSVLLELSRFLLYAHKYSKRGKGKRGVDGKTQKEKRKT